MISGPVAALISRYGLLAVFAGSLLEGEGVLIAAAILSAQGVLDPVSVWLTASTGAWVGHLCWFATGRAIRMRRLAPTTWTSWARVVKVKRLVEARPVMVLALLQYLYGVRLIGAIAVGLTELSFSRFASYEIANCLLWAALVGGVAFLLGGIAAEIFHGWFKWIWMISSAGVVLLLLRFVDRLLERIGIRGTRCSHPRRTT